MILTPQPRQSSGSGSQQDVELIGTKDGINKTFSTPDLFIHDTATKIEVFVNGVKKLYGASNDFVVGKSGATIGWDLVILNHIAPLSFDNVTAKYLIYV